MLINGKTFKINYNWDFNDIYRIENSNVWIMNFAPFSEIDASVYFKHYTGIHTSNYYITLKDLEC